jgi:hypothetical protein
MGFSALAEVALAEIPSVPAAPTVFILMPQIVTILLVGILLIR